MSRALLVIATGLVARTVAWTPECWVSLDTACERHAGVPTGTWFRDSVMGGPLPTTAGACRARRGIWANSCQPAQVSDHFAISRPPVGKAVLYISSTSSRTAARAVVQRETWARRRQLLVISDGNAAEYHSYSRALGVSRGGVNLTMIKGAGSAYVDVPHKWVRAVLKLAKAGLPFQWYFFVDDDTFVFVDRLEKALARLNASRPSIFGLRYSFPIQINQTIAQYLQDCRAREKSSRAYFSKWKYTGDQQSVTYPQGGTGFAISRSALIALSDAIRAGLCPTGPGSWVDVRVGLCASAAAQSGLPIDFWDAGLDQMMPYCSLRHGSIGAAADVSRLLTFHVAPDWDMEAIWPQHAPAVCSTVCSGTTLSNKRAEDQTRFCTRMLILKRFTGCTEGCPRPRGDNVSEDFGSI